MAHLSGVFRALVILALVAGGTSCNKPAEQVPSQGSPKPAEPESKSGGYVVLPSPEPTVLNPILQATFDRATPVIFEGLVGLNSQLAPIPVLAESWEMSADGRVLTFQLRKNVTWHDGKPFSAADVVFTVELIKNGQFPTVWRGYMAEVASVEAAGSHIVKVTYAQPYAPALATWTLGILPKHIYDGQDPTAHSANRAPIGTGPYKFARWTPGKNLLLEANETYWLGRPHLDRIELLFAGDAALDALQGGKLDLAQIESPNDWTGLAQTPEFRGRYETGSSVENSFHLLAWNATRAPFKDARIRRAMTLALDRPRVLEDVYKGEARPISGPFSPRMWGADANIAPWPHDSAQASKLLDEAGVAPGNSRLTFTVLALSTRRGQMFDEMFAIFRSDLKKIGVELKVSYLGPADFIGKLTMHDFDAAIYEWFPDIADPDPYVLLHSSQIGAGANYAGYENADLDKLLEEARRTVNETTRRSAYKKAHAILHAEQPYTFLWSTLSHYAWNRRVHGVSPMDVSALPRFPGVSRWWVSGNKPASAP